MPRYRRMRATSARRRSSSLHMKYTGAPDKPREDKAKPTLALEPGTEGAVECPDCGTWVKKIQSGRPTSHAPGGYFSNVREGRIPCVSSGTVRNYRETGNGIYAAEALRMRLVTARQVVEHFNLAISPQQLVIRPGAPSPVGYLIKRERGNPALYRWEDMQKFAYEFPKKEAAS